MSASLTRTTNLIFFSMLSFVAIFIIKLEGERREEKKERKRHWRYIEALIMTPSVSLEIF